MVAKKGGCGFKLEDIAGQLEASEETRPARQTGTVGDSGLRNPYPRHRTWALDPLSWGSPLEHGAGIGLTPLYRRKSTVVEMLRAGPGGTPEA